MKILRMRASFGKLQGELALQDGMNVLTLPNEEGKSTWTAFIIAMLYGIDTKERSSQANAGLPAKERYRPWSGKPMEGSMDLEWKGRRITIERKSTPKAPMSLFRAYDTESGRELGALSGENCGRTLCGVERSVFERTAFIRQLGMSVNADDALEKRLGALVSTGEERSKSAPQLEKELQGLRNRLSGRSGRIPKLQTELTEAEQLHTNLENLQKDIQTAEADKTAQEQEVQRLADLLQRIDNAKQAKGHAALEDLSHKLEEQELLCQKLEGMTKDLPSEAELHNLQKRLDQAVSSLETAKMEAAFAPAPTPRPQAPSYFSELTVEQAEAKIRKDMETYAQLKESKEPKKALPLILCLLLFLGAGALAVLTYLELLPFTFPLPVAVGIAASALTLLLILFVVYQRRTVKHVRSLLQAQQILQQYRAEDVSELPQLLDAYSTAQKNYDEQYSGEAEQSQELADQLKLAQLKVEELIDEVAAFTPDCKTLLQARQGLAEALEARSTLTTEKRVLENQRSQHRSMKEIFGEGTRKFDFEAMNLDESKLRYEHRQAEQKLQTLCDRLAGLRGRMEAMGKPEAVETRKAELRQQLLADQQQLRSLDIALEALEAADNRLRSRFSPRITAEAGKILGQLTRGKYPAVQLSPEMQLSVRDGALQRPAAAMSCGTADQMYLALRLAMCRMLLPEDAPLILDDALVNFDDDRCDAAVEVLSEESKNRQVILFTCRTL